MALELQNIDQVWAERLGFEYDDYLRRKAEHGAVEYEKNQPTHCRLCNQYFTNLVEFLTIRCLTEKTIY